MGRGCAQRRRARKVARAAGLLLPASLAAPALAQPLPAGRPAVPPAAAAPGAAASISELVVTASGRPGAGPVGDVAPELSFDAAEIRALGASSVGELLGLIALQVAGRGQRGGTTVTLVNGAPVSSLFEIQDLPPEAIQRLEVLPEETALRYGYRADQLVLNLVLQPSLRSGTAQADGRASAAGHGESLAGDLDLLDIDGPARLQLDLKAARAWPLREAERDLPGASPFRTLLPLTEQVSLNAVAARPLGAGFAAAVNGRYEADRTVIDLGPAADGTRPLRQRSEATKAHLGLSAQGAVAGWRLSALANAERSVARSVTDTEGAGPEQDRAAVTAFDLQATAFGRALELPAGELTASLTAGVQTRRIESRSRIAGTAREADLSRTIGVVQGALEAPLLRRGSAADAGLGDLSANLSLALSHASDFGALERWRAGLNWSPNSRLRISIAESLEQTAPAIEDLGDPAVVTEGVRVFDSVRGETVLVTRREGGDPSLAAERRRQLRAGLTFKPLAGSGLTLRADYIATTTRGAVVSPTAVTAELEAALPGRFVRDAEGRLIAVDVRPFNLARREAAEARFGLSYSRTLPGGGALQLAALETERLQEKVRIAPAGAKLDLLAGEGLAAGRPRRQAEALAAVSRGGQGLRLTARWQGRATVRGGTEAEDLAFAPLTVVGLQAFADLASLPGARGAPWLTGARLTLAVDNLTDAHLKVRTPSGATPFSYLPAVTDPLGRTIRLSLRKALR